MLEYWLDHIHLSSPDPIKTAEFYEQMFGAKIIRAKRDEGDGIFFADLDLKGISILIIGQKGEDTQSGLLHFGIRTNNLDDAVALMRGKGVKFTQSITEVRPHFKVSFLVAPEGVSIELQEGRC